MDARRPAFQSPHTLTSSRDDRVAIREAGKMPAIEDKCLLCRKRKMSVIVDNIRYLS